MWMLSFVPDSLLIYIINGVLIAGAIGTFFTFFILHRVVRWIPSIAPFHLVLQIISIILLIGGVYFRSGYSVEMSWREKVAELEAKIKIAEEQSRKVNTEIVVQYRDRVKVVTDTKYVIQERIKEVEKLIDKECKVAPEAVIIHNDAARMPAGAKK